MNRRRGARARWILVGALAVALPATGAPWRLVDGEVPRALASGEAGTTVSLYRDRAGQVYLELRVPAGFSRLSRQSCPTFQIDKRVPLNHPALGGACKVEADNALYILATIDGRALTSRPVYDLMNGTRVAFRYVTEDGAYREATFSLQNSADSIRRALGRNVRVRAE